MWKKETLTWKNKDDSWKSLEVTQTLVTCFQSLETGICNARLDFSFLAVDLLKQEVIFNVVRLAATITICIGFLLMLLPEEWDEITLRFINSIFKSNMFVVSILLNMLASDLIVNYI